MEPEDKKNEEDTVVFLVYNMDEDDYEYLEMDGEAYRALCEAEKEDEARRQEAYERSRKEDDEATRWAWENEDRLREQYAEEMERRIEDPEEW